MMAIANQTRSPFSSTQGYAVTLSRVQEETSTSSLAEMATTGRSSSVILP